MGSPICNLISDFILGPPLANSCMVVGEIESLGNYLSEGQRSAAAGEATLVPCVGLPSTGWLA